MRCFPQRSKGGRPSRFPACKSRFDDTDALGRQDPDNDHHHEACEEIGESQFDPFTVTVLLMGPWEPVGLLQIIAPMKNTAAHDAPGPGQKPGPGAGKGSNTPGKVFLPGIRTDFYGVSGSFFGGWDGGGKAFKTSASISHWSRPL